MAEPEIVKEFRKTIMESFIAELKHMSPEERMNVIDRMTDIYCIQCGAEKPCYCWKDE